MGVENRQFAREKLRAGCEFRLEGGGMHAGVLADVSGRGLYIQSSFVPETGQKIELFIRADGMDSVPLTGRVARVRKSHRGAAVVIQGGFGVELDSAPEGFFRLLVDLGLG